MPPPTKARVRETYETIAESFAASRRTLWPEVLKFVDRLPPGRLVLDLGCGHGRHAAEIAGRGHRVVGIDFSRRLLMIGRTAGRSQAWGARVEWVEADGTSLPLRSESVDACTCVAVLHHLPGGEDRARALAEVRRVLVPHGRAFVSVWAMDQPRFQDVVRRRESYPPETRGDVDVPWSLPDGRIVPRYYHLFQEGELASLIIESGLEEETFFRGSGNIFALARKHG